VTKAIRPLKRRKADALNATLPEGGPRGILTQPAQDQEGGEPSTPAGAVFLSHASEDAEARRICGAERAGGIEVWLDKSELRKGRRAGG
jgi:hypothetical protein